MKHIPFQEKHDGHKNLQQFVSIRSLELVQFTNNQQHHLRNEFKFLILPWIEFKRKNKQIFQTKVVIYTNSYEIFMLKPSIAVYFTNSFITTSHF